MWGVKDAAVLEPAVSHRETENSTATGLDDLAKEDSEDREDEMEMAVSGNANVQDWAILHQQIKNELKKSKLLSLTHINQLMILSNFATLQLKGFSHMNASFEIAWQWHEGTGSWFARQVHALTPKAIYTVSYMSQMTKLGLMALESEEGSWSVAQGEQ
jgi:hypothetical protein